MNPVMETLFGGMGLTVEHRRKGGFRQLGQQAELYVQYVHLDMWWAFLNGHDHAAIVTACALLEHAIKDAIHFDVFIKADKEYDRTLWDRIEGMPFHNIVEYGRKQGVLTVDQERRFLDFKNKYRNKWMHGETPAYVKDWHLPEVIKADYKTGEVEKVPVDFGDNSMFQRVGRIAADRDAAPKVVHFVDEEVRELIAMNNRKNEKWQKEHGDAPPTPAQMDRVLENIRKKFGDDALDGLQLFSAHAPPTAT